MEEATIKIIVEGKGAEDAVKKLQKGIDETKDKAQDSGKEIEKSFKKSEKGAKGLRKGLKVVSTGFKGLGKAIAATGIGLLVVGFEKFKEVLNSNQKVVDTFNTVFETLSIAFNDLVNFLIEKVPMVSNFFKEIFENPKKSLQEFGDAVKKNLMERFNSFLDTLGFLASAIKKVFSGDFTGAMEDAKKAGKEYVDVLTGVNDSYDKGVEIVTEGAKALKDYTKQAYETAKENVELKKSAELLEVVNEGLIEKYDREAEALRQIRDDTELSIKDRIEANDKLATVLELQREKMLENAQASVDAAEAQLAKDKENQKFQIAYQESLNELAAIQATVTGLESEQKANATALRLEKKELIDSQIAGNNELLISDKKFLAEQETNEIRRIEMLKEALEEEKKIELDRLQAKKDSAKEGTQARIDAENEYNAKKQEIDQQMAKYETKLEELKLNAKVQGAVGAIQAVSQLIDQNSKAGKALAISMAIIDTFAGASKALAQGGIAGLIAAIPVVAAGMANVQKIRSQKVPSTKGGTVPTPSVSVPSTSSVISSVVSSTGAFQRQEAPSFGSIQGSGVNQIADALSKQPMRAYVVSEEVTTAQELDRKRIKTASFG